MKKIIINGQKTLNGTIRISGAKNSALALIPAAILTDEEATICNLPEISDVKSLEAILDILNVSYKRATESIIINPKNMKNVAIPEEIANKLRASYYFMGALLAKYNHVEMNFPGGCNIGKRPINLHIEGFKKMGAKVTQTTDKYVIHADELKGADITFDIASVGATINIMLAATKAKGTTHINNAAKEPEIKNVADFLNTMGAKIKGAGTSRITITGVDHLKSGAVEVIPDRIEAGTYVIIGTLIADKLKVDNLNPKHIKALLDKLKKTKAKFTIEDESVICEKSSNLIATDMETYYYPGFPTDLQQPFTTYLTCCQGTSTITENIYENRFMHVNELKKMNAKIEKISKEQITIEKSSLQGATVNATDLRAGASLIIAGLIAKGTTTITGVEHILRGYEGIIEKLKNVGADIKLVEED